jgi:hypothetical protein
MKERSRWKARAGRMGIALTTASSGESLCADKISGANFERKEATFPERISNGARIKNLPVDL